MREIKFRAWDKKRKCWAKDINDYMMGETLFDCVTQPIVNLINIVLSDTEDGLIWMQYTGLKDKKGKEIYEGDIVKWVTGWKNNKPIYENEEVCFHQKENIITWVLKDKFDRKHNFEGTFNEWELEEIEVIGNIYENKELLK